MIFASVSLLLQSICQIGRQVDNILAEKLTCYALPLVFIHMQKVGFETGHGHFLGIVVETSMQLFLHKRHND